MATDQADPKWTGKQREPASDDCLLSAVASAMREEPSLEAVKVNRERRTLSFATLGRPRSEHWEAAMRARLGAVERGGGEGGTCGLYDGREDCGGCPRVNEPEHAALEWRVTDGQTVISRKTCPTAPRFWRWREVPWPVLAPRRVVLPDEADHEREWPYQMGAAGLCGVSALVAHALAPGEVRTALAALAFVSGGWFPAVEVWERLRERVLDVHFLMLAVAAGSAAIGEWPEGAILLFLFSFSGALEHYAMGRTQREIRSLFKHAPKEATVLGGDGEERMVAVDVLEVGMRLMVRPGQQFPVDAEVVRGETAADESNLTGEAAPVRKVVGDTVLAGTLNLWGAVEATVSRVAAESSLQKLIRLIRDAQHLKAPSQRFTDRFGTPYTYGVLALCGVMFLVWWLGFGKAAFRTVGDEPSAFYRAMTLMVVASPCALVLSIPSAVLAAIAWAARRGVLFRGGAAVERLAEVTVVALDKTGTLTTGELRVDRVESFPPGREAEVERLGYSAERFSAHPLARAITRHGKHRGVEAFALEGVESVAGDGLRGMWEGREVKLGRKEWVIPEEPGLGGGAGSVGLSEVWVRWGELKGRLVLRDDVRPEARELLSEMRALGLRSVVLTGDREEAAAHLREGLGLDDVRAGLRPEEKVRCIQELSAGGVRVAMVGDGVNDAPSLAAAHVGVAMGARGSDAALEQAEVILMHDRLENFLTAYRLSRRAGAIIRQNLVISLGTVAVLAVAAMAGAIPLTVGVIGHEGSTVVVVLNSLRLLWTHSSETSGRQ